MRKFNLNLFRKYACPPLWMATFLKQGMFGFRSIGSHYPLTDEQVSSHRQPLFIISCGRSGTTLLRSMLVAGEQIAIPVETFLLHNLPVKFKAFQGLGWEDLSKLMIAEYESHRYFDKWEINLAPVYQKIIHLPEAERSLARIIDEVYMLYAAEKFPEAKIWGDQSPLHTFFLPYVNKIFPEAKYIHLLRDGRDVISSLVNRYGAGYLDEAIYRWTTSIKRTTEFQKTVGADQYLEVRYEDLVKEAEETLKRISQFINIEYTLRMLDYWKLPSTVEHKYDPVHKNLAKPVFNSSVGQWRDRLTEQQQDYVMENITKELQQTGYLD